MQRAQGFAQQGSQVVWTAGRASATLVQESAPYATIRVYLTGTTTLATIYSDNQIPPTPMANPFTADENGYWFFYAPHGRYDVMIEADPWTWTIGDILLGDGSSWSADQDAGAHWLNNLSGVSFSNGQCYASISLDPSCNLLFMDGGGNTLLSLSPGGDLGIPGILTAGGIDLTNGDCNVKFSLDPNCTLTISDGNGNPVAWLSTSDRYEHGPGYFNLGFNGVLQSSRIELDNGSCQASIGFDSSCNLVCLGAGGNTLLSLSPTGDLSIPGTLTAGGCIQLTNPNTSMWICLDADGNTVISDNSHNGKVWITQQGEIGIGTSNPNSTLTIVSEQSIEGLINAVRYTNDNYPPGCYQWKSRGTQADPLPIQTGDYIFRWHWGANAPGIVGNYGAIQAYIPGADLTQSDLIFNVNSGTDIADGQERLRITHDGKVMITGSLWVNGVQVTP